jgi:hypothetical protein
VSATRRLSIGALALALTACGAAPSPDVADDGGADAWMNDGATLDAATGETGAPVPDGALPDGRVVHGPYATRVVSFDPGPGAGFGQSQMPDVVLGPPVGGGDAMGSTDVVSLGQGGRICLAFDDVAIVDGDGPDLLVFENAFTRAGTSNVFAELGEVSVSDDGVTYHTFACTTQGPPYPGCAGWHAVYSRPDNGISATDPRFAGGDPFDLRDVGLARARYVCVHDLGTLGLMPPSTGFDLDAMAAVNSAPP